MPDQAKLNVKALYAKLCPQCREILIRQIKDDLVDQQIREQLEKKE
jgi:hypothetical protein